MLTDHFPLLGLRLSTPRLELGLPAPEQLGALADVASEGVHDPSTMPFTVPWTDLPPAERARSVVVHHWATLGAWSPASWTLPFTVIWDGQVVGQQSLSGKSFAVTRECSTGSWLGRRFHGRGIGTEMRAAVAYLAFAGLGATAIVSAAYTDNPASLGVSRKLGYSNDGINRDVVQGRLQISQRLRLSRERWLEGKRLSVRVDGLEPCLPLLGVLGLKE
ncbi:GNAT family N-acetyltransferase [Catelliglobosispora koreensis]|uniref:GNAT family N-acetyltransferase n=1 Tax=Catelliglobosispora koreensis TaxID=129052 RepID=UPI00047699AC|nr:GNAT family protein [Catelliglobosispora koreensis]